MRFQTNEIGSWARRLGALRRARQTHALKL
jgi:hypothetical protein